MACLLEHALSKALWRRSGGARTPSRPIREPLELSAGDLALGHDRVVDKDHGHAPVVEAEQMIVSVDVGQLRLDAELAEEAQGLVAQVTAGSGDQDNPHGPQPTPWGRP